MVPRNATGSVPCRLSSNDDAPFSYAFAISARCLHPRNLLREMVCCHTVDVCAGREIAIVG